MVTDDLTGRTALVTGATSGIGKATAVALAVHGARVLVAGRDKERGDAVVAAIRAAGGQADFLSGDLQEGASAKDLAHRAMDAASGQIDVLVNNAGWGPLAPTPGFDEATFDAVFATNLKAPFYLVGEIAPSMAERGKGSVITPTMAAEMACQAGCYGASKAALNLLTLSWPPSSDPRLSRVLGEPGTVRTPRSSLVRSSTGWALSPVRLCGRARGDSRGDAFLAR
jgi:NAD(P)-dependent dehydrogenase (short-subunit alcohol dehydrogenase family)